MEREQKKIKILFTIPNFNTAGSGKALFNIAKRLDKNYFEPHILCLNDKGKLFSIIKSSGIPIHIFNYISEMDNRIKGFHECWKVSRKLKIINPHLIHSFHYAPDYTEALSAKMAKIPWIFTKKNMNWGGKSKNGWKLRSFLANHIILLNTDMKNLFYSKYSNITLIPRGVALEEFSLNKTKSINKELNFSEEAKVLMIVANLVRVKGVELVIEAMKSLNLLDKNIHLVIIGFDEGDYAKKLKNIVKKENIKNISFLGKRDDICNLLLHADIFILPTVKENGGEGLPVALLEAMATGIPVLASNVSGSRDILNKLPNQLFIPENVSSITKKIIWLLNLDINSIKKIIDFQFEIINRSYLIENETSIHEALYKKIIKIGNN